MPNSASTKKRVRQDEKKRTRNKAYRTRSRALVKQARVAIEDGDVAAAEEATKKAVQMLDKVASKGIIHKRNAARRKGRLMSKLAALKDES